MAPFRWMWGTILYNAKYLLKDWFWYGPRNVLRWAPIIWEDADFDWGFLAAIMEYKLGRMASYFRNHGHSADGERCAHQMEICVNLLRRLREDNYFADAGYEPYSRWQQMSDYKRKRVAEHASYMSEQDKQMLGLLIGKYLDHWWD